jgi:RNA polymerase sigma factor (sigma-70 family)
MPSSFDNAEPTPPTAAQFLTTRWSVVLTAGHKSSPQAQEALGTLCQTYWYPLYAYIRRQGHSPYDAQDLTQEFFARFLEKDFLSDVHRERGRFRSFLLAALKHFLANEWDRARAQKRGGGRRFISLDEHDAESRYALEPRDELSADSLYERRWAMMLLERVLGQLREEFVTAGKIAQFDLLKGVLSAGRGAVPYAEVAARLKTTEAAVKVSVHRLRKRYRELLGAEIAQTVAGPDEVEDEVRYLFAILSG